MSSFRYRKYKNAPIFFPGFDLESDPDALHILGIPYDLAIESFCAEGYATLQRKTWDDYFSFGELRSYLAKLGEIPSYKEPLTKGLYNAATPLEILHVVLRLVSPSLQAQIVTYVRSLFPYYTQKAGALVDILPYHYSLYNTMTLGKGLLKLAKNKEHLWDWVSVTSKKIDPQFKWAKTRPFRLKGLIAQKDFDTNAVQPEHTPENPFEISFEGVHVEDVVSLTLCVGGRGPRPAIRIKGHFKVAPKVVFILVHSHIGHSPHGTHTEPFPIDLQGFEDSWVFLTHLPCTQVVVRDSPHIVEAYPPQTHPTPKPSTASFMWDHLAPFYSKAVSKRLDVPLHHIGGDLSQEFWEVFRHDVYPYLIAPYRTSSKDMFTHWIKRREKIHAFLNAPL